VRARGPIGEGGIPQPGQKGGKDMREKERERVKEMALVRSPWGPAGRPPDIRK
jgi:hypothetical protein